ncbi:MAG TPA: urate hydroxylase PuuD [Kofleriaceae bacterium]|nr:urate hydroxylase PuuD [Kofleriaceae bacterium]
MGWNELLDLLLRWFHVIAGIMWIGNSLLFNWLDRNLVKKEGIDGEIWLLHSGGFYQIEKKMLRPYQLPDKLHWFMWQNFSAWASGILLLVVVYYLGGSAWVVEPGSGHPSYSTAVSAAVGSLLGGWILYDLVWRSPLRLRPVLAGALCVAALFAIGWGLCHVMTPRAAYIHVGVLLGTLMTGNVWMVIIPSQRDLVDATREGREQDRSLSLRAKQRSIHNNYMTFPLIFIMVSNHYPSAYSHQLNWLILAVLMVGGALVRHFLNIRFTFRGWRLALATSAVLAVAAAYILVSTPARSGASEDELAAGPPVPFESVQAIVSLRCVACHSATPSDSLFHVAPNGLMFDRPEQIAAAAARMRVRVEGRTMPFSNRTQMTDEERTTFVRWAAQGARMHTPAPVKPTPAPAKQ